MPESLGIDPASLPRVLHDIVERLRLASGAEILSLYLYDADTETYYAPMVYGMPETGLAASLADMRDQLARYRADAAQDKAPSLDDLQFKHYGPNVWLTVTRRRLLTRNAEGEIDSSFIRRYRIRTVLGLPLVSDDRLVGLLYLNFGERVGPEATAEIWPTDELIESLERLAAAAAETIERSLEAEQRRAFVTIGKLAAQLSAPAGKESVDGDGFRQQLGEVLVHVLEASGFAAAAVYQLGIQRGRLALLSARGTIAIPTSLDIASEAPTTALANSSGEPVGVETFQRELGTTGLHLIATYPLRMADQLHGYLLILSQDRLALVRQAPVSLLFLSTAADLIAGALASQRLVGTLEDTNRVLGALSRMSTALLQPGATRQQVLDAVVRHLTDPGVPEFDFQFAAVFLLDEVASSTRHPGDQSAPLVVRLAAGAVSTAGLPTAISSAGATDDQGSGLVPRWAQITNRTVASDDVLAYVARHWQVVVVGAIAGDEDQPASEDLTVNYPPDQLRRHDVPAIRTDGTTSAEVPTILIGPAAVPATVSLRRGAAPPFTLDGDLFDEHGHGDLVRVFVPFGLDPRTRASGVLEAGFHHTQSRQLERTPIEALRACAAQVAVAVETARLYEEVKWHADQLAITSDVSKAIASSIDLDQTLRLVTRNLVRLIDASLCQIALYEEDGSAWYGAAASDEEEVWRRLRGERPEASFLFDVLDRRAPLVIEDAQNSDLISPNYARLFDIRSLLALPLIADDQPIGAVVLAQRDRLRSFTPDEVQRTYGLAHQAAIALKNARQHALSEEERHIQKDVVLLGFGQWAQRSYEHLLTLKQFFNFKTHVVAPDRGPERRAQLAEKVAEVLANGDAFYWDSPTVPAHEQLRRALESSCYVITYVVTPAATHLQVVAQYYDLSNVIVIEKPLGAPLEAYRDFLESVDGSAEIVAADHYYFKIEVRLLQLLLTEERTLKAFLDTVEEIEIELLEEKSLEGAAGQIGIIADMIPHAFAIVSLFTPIDRIHLATDTTPLAIGRQEPLQCERETYARLVATFTHQGRQVRLIIVAGKGIEDSKWIKLSGEKRPGGRRSFYKFDFGRGEAIDGTQTNLRAAVRRIREAGVPDTAHLTMLRHVIEKRHPAVGILAIREAMRSNQRIQELQAIAEELLARGEWTPYQHGQRPSVPQANPVHLTESAQNPNGTMVHAG